MSEELPTLTDAYPHKLQAISELPVISIFTDSPGVVVDQSFASGDSKIEVSFKAPDSESYISKSADFKAFTATITNAAALMTAQIADLSSAVDDIKKQITELRDLLDGIGSGSNERLKTWLNANYLALSSSEPQTVGTSTTFVQTINGTAKSALWS